MDIERRATDLFHFADAPIQLRYRATDDGTAVEVADSRALRGSDVIWGRTTRRPSDATVADLVEIGQKLVADEKEGETVLTVESSALLRLEGRSIDSKGQTRTLETVPVPLPDDLPDYADLGSRLAQRRTDEIIGSIVDQLLDGPSEFVWMVCELHPDLVYPVGTTRTEMSLTVLR